MKLLVTMTVLCLALGGTTSFAQQSQPLQHPPVTPSISGSTTIKPTTVSPMAHCRGNEILVEVNHAGVKTPMCAVPPLRPADVK